MPSTDSINRKTHAITLQLKPKPAINSSRETRLGRHDVPPVVSLTCRDDGGQGLLVAAVDEAGHPDRGASDVGRVWTLLVLKIVYLVAPEKKS